MIKSIVHANRRSIRANPAHTAAANEAGDNSHQAYKARQHERVKTRLSGGSLPPPTPSPQPSILVEEEDEEDDD